MAHEHRSDDHSNMPTWDGNPSTWTSFSNEVKLWRLSENLEVNFSLASRLVRKLSGSDRRAVATLVETVLHPAYVVTGDRDATPATEFEKKAWRNKQGIENVMSKLLADLGQRRSEKAKRSMSFSEPRSTRGAALSGSPIG